MKTFTLYGLRKPGEEARYIGITSQSLEKRLAGHLREKQDFYKNRWIAQMRQENLSPEIIPYCVRLTLDEANSLEREVIRELKNQGVRLVNSSDGGIGITMTPETCKKISLAMQGNTRRQGQSQAQETREKISIAQRGGKNHNFGKKASTVTRKKMSDSAKKGPAHPFFGKPLPLDTRRKMSAARQGTKDSVETCGKKKAAQTIRREREQQEKVLAEMWGDEFNLFGGSRG